MRIMPALPRRSGGGCHRRRLAVKRKAADGVGLRWPETPFRLLLDGVHFRVSSLSTAQSAPLLPMTEERRVALERLFTRIGDVTTLPAAAQKVLTLTQDEN